MREVLGTSAGGGDRPARTSSGPAPHAGGDERERAIVTALRRIIRAVDLHSRRLREEHGLTGPQLATLRELERCGRLTPAEIAERIHLSRGTVTGILARLERDGLIARSPSERDRRSVLIAQTERGHALLANAPSMLQEQFRRRLSELQEWEQHQILATLQRVVALMDASGLDASPHLVTRSEDLGAAPDARARAGNED